MRYFLELSYNGKAYHGWQNQPNATSVQEVLENALSTVLNTTVAVVGAGRTDAGVHASQMFAHFDFETPLDLKDLAYKLNSFLPKDVAVSKVFNTRTDAHARFDALSRTYNYNVSIEKNVFDYDFSHKVHAVLDVDAMNAACKILFEYNNFQCFSKNKTSVRTYNCVIKEAFWSQKGHQLVFTITADRFLRNMVRAIVGTMLSIGLGKISADEMHHIIRSKDRGKAGTSVPAHGLYLVKIVYPKHIKLATK